MRRCVYLVDLEKWLKKWVFGCKNRLRCRRERALYNLIIFASKDRILLHRIFHRRWLLFGALALAVLALPSAGPSQQVPRLKRRLNGLDPKLLPPSGSSKTCHNPCSRTLLTLILQFDGNFLNKIWATECTHSFGTRAMSESRALRNDEKTWRWHDQ